MDAYDGDLDTVSAYDDMEFHEKFDWGHDAAGSTMNDEDPMFMKKLAKHEGYNPTTGTYSDAPHSYYPSNRQLAHKKSHHHKKHHRHHHNQ
jgi:hypothetical protein